jgi:hypothetical protein
VAGIATFSSLSINTAGSGYTLSATAPGLTAAASAAFDITPSAASHLVFTVQPSDATAGVPIASMQVTARDAFGNPVTTFTDSVTAAIAAGSGATGATLTGTTTVAAVGGAAMLSGLSIDKSGTGYMLTATSAGIAGVASAFFDIHAGPAAQLVFIVPPSTATAGATITPQVEVTARDALGNTAVGFTENVTMAIESNPAGGTLSGTTTVAASAGVAVFADLNIDKAGSGYTLTAAAPGPAGATSTAFEVTAAQADRLVFVVQPTSATAGANLVPAVEVVPHQ